MSPHLEFEDKTVEKAVGKACEELNVPREKLKYDVISYGSTGIFGLVGIRKARIRVTHLPPGKTADQSYKNGSVAPAPGSDTPAEEHGASAGGHVVKNGTPAVLSEASEDIDDEHEEDFYDVEEEDIEDDVISPESQPDGEGHDEDGVPLLTGHEDAEREITETESASLELGKNALQRIVDFITADASISVKIHSERITFHIQGGNTAVLIGKRGQTLEAIQYLVEKVVNKNLQQRIRIQVDIEGYLDGRRARLESLAARLSEKAKRIGKPITIGQLNAHDRRIVHIALKDDTGVRTQSMGEGFYRKLVIFPQKSRSRKKDHV